MAPILNHTHFLTRIDERRHGPVDLIVRMGGAHLGADA